MLIDRYNDEYVDQNKMFSRILIKMNKNLDYMVLNKILLMLILDDLNGNLMM
jgi:hypothetical protein